MKKFITLFLFVCMMATLIFPGTTFAKTGDIIGYAKYTDISAYINHYPITSYNINDYTAIVAEDLIHYGFDVAWDGNARTLSITKDDGATQIIPPESVYRYSSVAGMDSFSYLETDIKTYVNGGLVESFNVNGKTCIIIDSLSPYGEVVWVPELRAIKLWVDSLPTRDYAVLDEAPVTTMYSRDGRTLVVEISEIEAYKAVGWFLPQSSAIDPTKPMVAITFDDGPSPNHTTRILDTLERYNAHATFFVLGSQAERYPHILLRMKELGCQIGNHTYNHPQLTTLSAQSIAYQLNKTSEIVANATGTTTTAIRPPYGSYNKNVSSVAGTPLILWSIDTLDWKSRNALSVVNSVLPKVQDGDIILLHDIYGSTATATETIVPELIARGFQLVTIDELAYYKNKTLAPGSAYSRIK